MEFFKHPNCLCTFEVIKDTEAIHQFKNPICPVHGNLAYENFKAKYLEPALKGYPEPFDWSPSEYYSITANDIPHGTINAIKNLVSMGREANAVTERPLPIPLTTYHVTGTHILEPKCYKLVGVAASSDGSTEWCEVIIHQAKYSPELEKVPAWMRASIHQALNQLRFVWNAPETGPDGWSNQKAFKQLVEHPVGKDKQPLKSIIINLNDTHSWSREKIADWLDTLDEQPKFYPRAEQEDEGLANSAIVRSIAPTQKS